MADVPLNERGADPVLGGLWGPGKSCSVHVGLTGKVDRCHMGGVMQVKNGFLPGERTTARPSGVGPLSGKAFAVKDVFDVRGSVTGLGNPDWVSTHGLCSTHAEPVELLLSAGGRLVGKTITDEFAYSLLGENAHYGTPPNPALPGAVPGGSSSGSASVVAAGLADVALGTDTGGSARIPASYCGVFGFRPTHGQVSRQGVAPLSPSFDTVGWFARSALDLLSVGKALLPEANTRADLLETCVVPEFLETVPRDLQGQADNWQRHLRKMKNLAEGPELSVGVLQEFLTVFQVIQRAEVWACYGGWVRENSPKFGPGIRERMEAASQTRTDDERIARASLQELRSHVRTLIGDHRIVCTPTTGSAAPPLSASQKFIDDVRSQTLRMTVVAGIGGLPQVTLPLLKDSRGPVGLSLIGPPNSDRALLALAVDLVSNQIGVVEK